MARQRRPEHLKLIAGTTRPDRPPDLPPVASDEALTELPPPPAYLQTDEGKSEWALQGNDLIKSGWLSARRLSALGIYCRLHACILQTWAAGATPSAHMLYQYRGMQKDLGIAGMTAPKAPTDADRKPNRWAKLRERAEKPE
jgi:hypothetical protein